MKKEEIVSEKKASIHILPAKINSVLEHNLRTEEYVKGLEKAGYKIYFEKRKRELNESWYNESELYRGKHPTEIFNDLVELYKAKIKQKPQLKDYVRVNKKTGKEYTIPCWSPVREGVVLVKEDTKMEDFTPIIKWFNSKGISVISIDIHRDEGHLDAETNEFKPNLHAHMLFDWVDRTTGKTIKLGKEDLSELQDIVAESLKMTRGDKKEITQKRHIKSSVFRVQKETEEVIKQSQKMQKQAEFKINELNNTITLLEEKERKKQAEINALDEEYRKKQAEIKQQEQKLKEDIKHYSEIFSAEDIGKKYESSFQKIIDAMNDEKFEKIFHSRGIYNMKDLNDFIETNWNNLELGELISKVTALDRILNIKANIHHFNQIQKRKI